MIDAALAHRFIEQVTKYTTYNVNIMNENGIIIASRNPKREGQYHVIAHQILLSGKEQMEIQSDTYPGVQAGLNMVIEVDGVREGVVGVTGKPDEIRPVALMVKMAIETMLRYERAQEERRRRENRKEQFIYLLTKVPYTDHDDLLALAKELGYPEERIRVPILIKLEEEEEGQAEEVLMLCRESKGHTRTDFSIVPDPSHVLVFKSVPDLQENLLTAYKGAIWEYLTPIQEALQARSIKALFFVGSFQENYKQYYHAYRHCKWLEYHLPPKNEQQTLFFYDHLPEYVAHITPMDELGNLFHIYEKRVPEKIKKNLLTIILPLHRNNWSFPQTAAELFLHKNTLVYRYNQIKELLGLDPLTSGADRILLVAFCVYLTRTGAAGER